MRSGFLLLSFVGIVSACGVTRADIFEVPLPISGTYQVRDERTFDVDFGTEFSEIREARLYIEGTMIAPLRGPFGYPPYTPVDGLFQVFLDHPTTTVVAHGPRVGEGTYPDPEPFAGEDVFSELSSSEWGHFLDGRASGSVSLVFGRVGGNDSVVGGTGIITRASLIFNATAIPEPAGTLLGAFALTVLSKRRW